MKNCKKRMLIFLSGCLMMFALFAGGCKGCKGSPDTDPTLLPDYTLNLYDEQLEILLGNDYVLEVEFSKVAEQTLQFTSENQEIATVDEYGRITAHSVGETKITVSYGKKTAECLVRVYIDNYKPLLYLPQVPKDSVNVLKGNSLNLKGKVMFNGKSYDDVVIDYSLSDDSIGTIENGTFTALKRGETIVTAQATWRGISGETMYKQFSLSVLNDVQLYVNNGQNGKFLIYTQDTQAVSFTAAGTANGMAIDKEEITVDFVKGEDLLFYDRTAETLKSKGLSGEAEISLSYIDNEGEEYEALIPVSIRPTIREYAKTITGFSAVDGNVVYGQSFAEILGSPVVEAYDINGEALEVQNGNVYGIETVSTGKTHTTITICSRSVGYKINLEGYTRIIDEASDLSIFGVYNTVSGNYSDAHYQDGYYILANNIDASSYVHPSTGTNLNSGNAQGTYGRLGKEKLGLMGTFDGNGYTIHDLSLTRFGLFGQVLGGTIKNVAFENVLFAGPSTGSGGSSQLVLAQWIGGGTLENVYIHARVAATNPNARGFVAGDTYATMLSNCIFVLDEDVTQRKGYGSFASVWSARKAAGRGNDAYANVYVISPTPLTYVPNTNTNGGDNSYTVDGENRLLDDGVHKLVRTGIKRYDTFEDMRANKNYFSDETLAENAYHSFYNNCWDMSSGIPVWKTLGDETGKWEADNEFVEDFPSLWN